MCQTISQALIRGQTASLNLENTSNYRWREPYNCCTARTISINSCTRSTVKYHVTSTAVAVQAARDAIEDEATYVSVLHITPFYSLQVNIKTNTSMTPVDIQHTPRPCRFFLLQRHKLRGHKTMTETHYIHVMLERG